MDEDSAQELASTRSPVRKNCSKPAPYSNLFSHQASKYSVDQKSSLQLDECVDSLPLDVDTHRSR